MTVRIPVKTEGIMWKCQIQLLHSVKVYGLQRLMSNVSERKHSEEVNVPNVYK